MFRSARRFSGIAAFLFMLLRVVAPEFGHACAMEASVSPTVAAAPHAAHVAQGGEAHAVGNHAGHDGHHAPAVTALENGSQSDAAPTELPAQQCDCADWSCCLPAITRAPALNFAAATVVAIESHRPAIHAGVRTVAPVPFALPVATAPPAI